MSDTITLTGIVATAPRHLVTSSGLAITSFRLASSQRRFDRTKQAWVDAETNWYTVSAFRQLAHNVVGSVTKGQHVVVAGRLRIRPWENADRNGTSVEVEADTVGHDLAWCTTTYHRTPAPERALEPAADLAEHTGGPEHAGGPEGADAPARLVGTAPAGTGRNADDFLPADAPALVSLDV